MPELPEVETIRLQLNKFLVGHRIEEIEVRTAKVFSGEKDKILDAKILGTRRYGKVLVIDLDNKYSILIHLKLTGQLVYQGPNLLSSGRLSEKIGELPGKHTRVIFRLDKNGKLYFNDLRKFGWVKVVKSDRGIGDNLGPEPLKDLTLEKFKNILSKSSRPIKIILMDQAKIAGVGNIYASDALYLAKIHPQRSAENLNISEQSRLLNSIEKVLRNGIKAGGASDQYYVTPAGGEGKYQEHFLVYGREGEKCQNKCGGIIKKMQLGGRGTYFCPKCQRF